MNTAVVARSARAFLLTVLVSVGPCPSANAQEPDSLGVVERYVAAWNAHDPEAATTILSDSARYFSTGFGEEVSGREGVRKVLRGLLTVLPDLHWSILGKPIVEPTRVAFEWEVSGTYMPSGQIAAKPVRVRGVTFATTSEGRIVYLADYYNGETMRQQLAP